LGLLLSMSIRSGVTRWSRSVPYLSQLTYSSGARDFRAVSLGRCRPSLPRVSRGAYGCTNLGLGLRQSREYEDWPKVIMAVDGMHLDYTYREITSDTPADEAARLTLEYPTRIQDRSGERIWPTRLPETAPRGRLPTKRSSRAAFRGIPSTLQAVFVFMPRARACFVEGDASRQSLASGAFVCWCWRAGAGEHVA